MNKKRSLIHGFTLLEILVAIAIMLVITAIGVVSYGTVNRRARDTRRVSDMEQIRQALEMYRSDNGFYPAVNTGGFGTVGNLSTLVTGGYIPALPQDPQSGNTYQYRALNPSGGNYYGYCVCANLENAPANPGTCSALGGGCDYGQKNP